MVQHGRRPTWTEATHASPWQGRIEVAYAASNPDIVYASIDMGGGQIWRSADGGASYKPSPVRNSDGVAASYLGDQGWYGNVVWAGDPTDADLILVGGVNLWRSTDGGNTAAEISTWWTRPRRTRTSTPSSRTPATTAPPTGPCSSATTAGSTAPRTCGRSATTRLHRTSTAGRASTTPTA